MLGSMFFYFKGEVYLNKRHLSYTNDIDRDQSNSNISWDPIKLSTSLYYTWFNQNKITNFG